MKVLGKVLPVGFFSVAAVYLLVRVVVPSAFLLTDGFVAYYTSARLALAGQESALFYDDRWFQARTVEFTRNRATDIYFANPPTTSLMLLPLAGASTEFARMVWTAFNFVALLCAFAVLTIATRLKLELALLLSSLVTLSTPVAANFAHGQAYILLLLLFALALWASTRRRGAIVGAAMAIALILKTSGSPIWLLMGVRKQAKALAAGFAALIVLALGTLPLVGVGTWRFYLATEIPHFLQDPSVTVTAYQTVRSMTAHLFQFDAVWNPTPILNAPMFGIALALLLTLIAIGTSLLVANKTDPAHAYAIFAALSVLLAPIAEEYHFVLMVVPAFVLVAKLAVNPDPISIVATAGALFLVGAPINYKDPSLIQGSAALLAYPRLYGGCLLWAILMKQGLPARLPANRQETKLASPVLSPSK